MIQETGATSDESDDGIRTIKFHRKNLLHIPDFFKPRGTKKTQVVLSGRGNVVAVLIRKIPISQAYLICLWPPCFILLGPAQCFISFLGRALSFMLIWLCFIFMPISWVYWIGKLTTSHPGRLSAVEYHITEVNRNSAPVHFDAVCWTKQKHPEIFPRRRQFFTRIWSCYQQATGHS